MEASGEWETRLAGSDTSLEVLRLNNGTHYEFQVRIVGPDDAARSPWSELLTATPQATIAGLPDAAVRHITVDGAGARDGLVLQFTRGAIFLTSDTHDVLLEDLYVDMQPEKIGGRGGDHPVGIALYDTVRDIIVRRATVMNVVGRIDGYTQGHGIDGETPAKDMVEHSYFRGSQDGCIDTRSARRKPRAGSTSMASPERCWTPASSMRRR